MGRLTLCVVAFLSFSASLSAEVRDISVLDDGKELRRIARLVTSDVAASPTRLLAQLERIASEDPARQHAARHLELLVLAEYGREDELADAEEVLQSEFSIDQPWWTESVQVITEGGLADDEQRKRALEGKVRVTLEVDVGGEPFDGQVTWQVEDNPDAIRRIPVVEGAAGPFLLPSGAGAFTALVDGRPVELGMVELAGWSAVAIELSASKANDLEILWPSGADTGITQAHPTFRWSYDPRPKERMEVSVAKHIDGTSWLTIWGPVPVEGREVSFGEGQEPHEGLRRDGSYELVVTVIAPPDPLAGPAAPPERRSRARRFTYRPE